MLTWPGCCVRVWVRLSGWEVACIWVGSLARAGRLMVEGTGDPNGTIMSWVVKHTTAAAAADIAWVAEERGPKPACGSMSAPTQQASASPLMVGNKIDGKAVADQIKQELRDKVAQLKASYGRVRRGFKRRGMQSAPRRASSSLALRAAASISSWVHTCH